MAESFLVDARVDSTDQLDARTDLELVAAINGGDATAFDSLYFRYRDWVVGLAYRWTGDADLALDVLQETFLYVLKKFPGFRLTANFKTFLYPAVKHLSLGARRKSDRYRSAGAELDSLEHMVAPDCSERGGELAQVMQSLSEQHRETLLLRFVDGLSLGEIATALDIPLGTVKSRLHFALSALRQDPRTKEFFEH
jgi:RNA polymerase sigma-70 factor, ECF subfamily